MTTMHDTKRRLRTRCKAGGFEFEHHPFRHMEEHGVFLDDDQTTVSDAAAPEEADFDRLLAGEAPGMNLTGRDWLGIAIFAVLAATVWCALTWVMFEIADAIATGLNP